MNGRGGDHLVLVVDELRERVLEVADARLEEHVGAPHLFLERHVLEDRHHALADVAAQQVVQVLDARPSGRASRCSSVYRAAATSASG